MDHLRLDRALDDQPFRVLHDTLQADAAPDDKGAAFAGCSGIAPGQ
jgi:hypothetical protein